MAMVKDYNSGYGKGLQQGLRWRTIVVAIAEDCNHWSKEISLQWQW